MTSPLVATKLFVPRLRSSAVDRTRLASALGGAGRSSRWSRRPRFDDRVAGRLDSRAAGRRLGGVPRRRRSSRGRPSGRTWSRMHAAPPDVGASILPMLQAARPAPAGTCWQCSMGTNRSDIDLVLDDYHLGHRGLTVTDGMTLDHLPPNLHVVLITHADPDLPLAPFGLGKAGRDPRDLHPRRRPPRTCAMSAVSALGEVDVATLADRTEGWRRPCTLHALDAASPASSQDLPATTATVVDYLADEVLSPAVR